MKLTAPYTGVTVDAPAELAERLIAGGYVPAEQPKPAPRKRAAKPKPRPKEQ
jgi:hypothetical protein